MKDNKLHTPPGVKDYTPDEYNAAADIKRRISSVFTQAGFRFVSAPALEYADVFEGKGSAEASRMFRFIDRDGEIVALRPDMTPSVARMAVTSFKACDFPLRLCYIENIFRQNEDYRGRLREFTQGGIELMGLGTIEADCEVIAAAARSCLACGLTDFRIDIGQVEFLKSLLDDCHADKAEKDALMECLLSRDYVGVSALAKNMAPSAEARRIFDELPLLSGGPEIFDLVRNINNERARAAISVLEKLHKMLCDMGLGEYIRFDLGMIGHLDYYTGIIFRGFARGTGYSVLDGGRYDKLCAQFGADIPSVGFAININYMRDAAALRDTEGELTCGT